MLVSPKVSPKRVVIHTAFHLRPLCCAEKLGDTLITTTGGIVHETRNEKAMHHLLSIKETQEKLRVSRSSVYRLLHRGELNVVYVLSAPRVTAESLDDYVETRLAAGTAVK